MLLLDQLQSTVPPVVIGSCGPLLIVSCFIVSFWHWLHAKWYVAVAVYTLSTFTYVIARAISPDLMQAALVGGILAPAFYGCLFVGFGVFRLLRKPYGYGIFQRSVSRQSRSIRLLKSMIGGCVGGVTGSTLGGLFSFLLVILFSLPSSSATLTFPDSAKLQPIVDSSVLFFGIVGISLGGLAGWGYLNQKQLSDQILISLTIQIFVLHSFLKRVLNRILGRKN